MAGAMYSDCIPAEETKNKPVHVECQEGLNAGGREGGREVLGEVGCSILQGVSEASLRSRQ